METKTGSGSAWAGSTVAMRRSKLVRIKVWGLDCIVVKTRRRKMIFTLPVEK
jgi:hypothetical protein